MSSALPTNVGTGLVVGQFLRVVGNAPTDPNRDPDAVPAQGTALFTASPAYLIDASASPNPVTILPAQVSCVLDPNGYLRGPDGGLGVYLIATSDTDLNPNGWTWTAQINLTGYASRAVSFSLAEGTTVDLTTVQPVAQSAGVPIVVGPPGRTGPQGDPGPPGGDLIADWAPSTAYVANQMVRNPSGALVRRIANGTSGATYDPSKWTVLSATDTSKLAIASNLSDLASASTALANLGTDAAGTARPPVDGSVTTAKVAAANKDGAAGTPSMRTLGTGAGQSMAGNTRLDQIPAPSADVSFNSRKGINALDPTAAQDLTTLAWVNTRLAALVGTAPANLDTLQEIAAQLATDESASSALTTAVAARLVIANLLSEIAALGATQQATARTNLGVGTDSAAGTASLRTLGTAATQAAPGNRTLDKVPTPVADVAIGAHRITGLSPGLAGTDAATVGQIPIGGGAPTGPAGGSLAGTFPNPTLAAGAVGTNELDPTALDGKVDTAQLAIDATANSVALRTGTGRVRVAGPLSDADAVDLGTFNTRLAAMQGVPLTVGPGDFNMPQTAAKVDISGLSMAVAANTAWFLESLLIYDASTVADASFGLSVPAGATATGKAQGMALSGTNGSSAHRTDAITGAALSIDVAGFGLGVYTVVEFNVYIVVGATAGNITLRVGQVTQEATTGHVRAGSWMLPAQVA